MASQLTRLITYRKSAAKALTKPFSQSCENNKAPILDVLKKLLDKKHSVLEVGSGTGQHAVYFAKALTHLIWQTADQAAYHAGIQQWIGEASLDNVHDPLLLNVNDFDWRQAQYDAVFTANTLHIMSEQAAQYFTSNVHKTLNSGGLFIAYGPFNYDGEFTSSSNMRFNDWLKTQNQHSAIRDFEVINQCAQDNKLQFYLDYKMPANNRLLVWKKAGLDKT